MRVDKRTRHTLWYIGVFAIAFAFVESSVVVYLRALYYPDGFRFPLALMEIPRFQIELAREAATMVMLGAVAFLAGTRAWERFGYFLVAFGVWDIFYYVWLKLLLGWPATVTDWDVLFLIPLPWIGPVIAPVLLSLVMIGGGITMVVRMMSGEGFHFGRGSWVLSVVATLILVLSFVSDTDATLKGAMPSPYHYELLVTSIAFYVVAFVLAVRPHHRGA
jgi:hypothetical protein